MTRNDKASSSPQEIARNLRQAYGPVEDTLPDRLSQLLDDLRREGPGGAQRGPNGGRP